MTISTTDIPINQAELKRRLADYMTVGKPAVVIT